MISLQQGAGRVLPHYWQEEGEVQAPHLASVDTQGQELLIPAGRGGNLGSLRGLHWYCGGGDLVITAQWWNPGSLLGLLWYAQQEGGGNPGAGGTPDPGSLCVLHRPNGQEEGLGTA